MGFVITKHGFVTEENHITAYLTEVSVVLFGPSS
jgi:hypothetical protein